ncbi:TetR family transcriptional regulator [Ensifer sp. ENS07]|jgi:AcrR family transcriptional regulator|uniref:TetR family transcriptional regulator n=1 Tax=Ensifer adhaerens TaxID=106592 RepID=A0A9Q8Y5V5_ENSAD|nr:MULTISPECIES: TetR/AcrR family transcriptional regulator [Ensifer]MBD9591840.1 TetR family transcriptional regulator [Ensifer sp. ENS05]MBD9636733.1 TetR family transcriptional regulator [Ensifer sp. ENS07]USJ21822.1 TetR family transcriptional regulator [Ensifer adhaerens]UTV35137.1 TetR family transcriptional regulator [Ensifer adhaerens]SDL30397.1 transcriptional regulator, TetR family [Ensifer sp. YR511]
MPAKKGAAEKGGAEKRPAEKDGRRRDANATRAAILESARSAFIASGYEGAGVREIAEGAGVTAMLINRYFGSKEGLFAEVLSTANQRPIIATPETLSAPDRAARIASALLKVTEPEATALDGFLIMLRSISNERAVDIARQVVESHHQKNVTEALSGADAGQRAALLMSLVAGVQIMRQVVGLEALNKGHDAELERLLGDLVARLVDE